MPLFEIERERARERERGRERERERKKKERERRKRQREREKKETEREREKKERVSRGACESALLRREEKQKTLKKKKLTDGAKPGRGGGEQVRVVGPADPGQEPPVARDDVERLDGVRDGALRRRGRLDPPAREGAAGGDPRELGHDRRDEPAGQRRRCELVLGRSRLHVEQPLLEVDGDHAGEPRDVDRSGLLLVQGGQGPVGVGDAAGRSSQGDLVPGVARLEEACVVPADALDVLSVPGPSLQGRARGAAGRKGVVGDEAAPRDAGRERKPERRADLVCGDCEGHDEGEGRGGDQGLSGALPGIVQCGSGGRGVTGRGRGRGGEGRRLCRRSGSAGSAVAAVC